MPCIICFTAIIFNIILILFSVYIFCQTKIAATHCAAASCGLRPLLYALFCNKLTLEDIDRLLASLKRNTGQCDRMANKILDDVRNGNYNAFCGHTDISSPGKGGEYV